MATTAVLWSIALTSAVFGITAPEPWFRWLATAIYQAASLVCHQRPERSFMSGAIAWPVCARCTGLYGGALLGSVAALAVPLPVSWDHLVSSTRRWLALAAAPTILTVVFEWTTGVTPHNVTRALTAVPLGLALAIVLIAAVRWPARAVAIH